MRTFSFIILFLVGITEIVFGVLLGGLRIYAIEAPFSHELGINEQQNRIFLHYLNILKDQWHVVSLFGVITLLATGFLFWSFKRSMGGHETWKVG